MGSSEETQVRHVTVTIRTVAVATLARTAAMILLLLLLLLSLLLLLLSWRNGVCLVASVRGGGLASSHIDFGMVNCFKKAFPPKLVCNLKIKKC